MSFALVLPRPWFPRDLILTKLDNIEMEVVAIKMDVASIKTDVATLKWDVGTLKNDFKWMVVIAGSFVALLLPTFQRAFEN